MIELSSKGQYYKVKYNGSKNSFMTFINYMCKNKEAYKEKDIGWKLPKCYLPELQELFSNIDIVSEPWDYIGKTLKYEPFDYQKETIYFALNNPQSLLILGCGAGKSLCMISIYDEMLKANMTDKPCIVVVKASLKYQWVKEVEKFSNYKAVAVETPSKAGKKFSKQFLDADFFIVNYETLLNDSVVEELKNKDIECMFLDEIQMINQHKAKRSIAAYQFNDLKYKIGATATPITNNPLNVYGIFKMIHPETFPSYSKFSNAYIKWARFGQIAGSKNESHLVEQIRPYIFIKTEEEIADQLPSLVINQYTCVMSNGIKKVNDNIMNELEQLRIQTEEYEEAVKDKNSLETNEEFMMLKAMVMAHQTFAQELADDPRLLSLSDSNMAKEFSCNDKSPKLELLLDILDSILPNKVCIFTKFERMQRLIIDALEKKYKNDNYKIAKVNGSMSPEERYEEAYTNFQYKDEYKILVGTDAMSAGVSLSLCNYLIEYDLANSYADQTQRHGRIKRADSIHKTSYVYQLICEDTWDAIQQKIISKKEKYDDKIIKALK